MLGVAIGWVVCFPRNGCFPRDGWCCNKMGCFCFPRDGCFPINECLVLQ